MLKKEKGELTKKSKAGIEVERATPGSSFWSTLDSFLVICLDSLFGDFRLKFLATTGFFFGRSVPPCQPLGEEEEGHCDEQVESPIGRRGNTGTEAKLGKGAEKKENYGLDTKHGGSKRPHFPYLFCLYSSLKIRIL